MRKYKYAFIGGGPAALSALYGLDAGERASCIVLEAGDPIRKVCPALKQRTCTSCSENLCPILNGVGGASFGFGNKLCEFPASQYVAEGILPEELGSIGHIVSSMFSDTHLIGPSTKFSAHPGYQHRKHYTAQIALADHYRNSIKKVADYVLPECDMQTGFIVSDIELVSDEFWITSEAGGQVRAENVIFASGRSGHSLLRRTLPNMGISLSENLADVGFRIVTKTENFADTFFYQTDPKYKFEFADLGSARTFCTCKGGIIVPVKFGKGFYADGAFVRTLKESTNVAIMARSKEVVDYNQLEDWCSEVNERGAGSLTLGSFQFGDREDKVVADIIKDFMPTGLSQQHDALLGKMIDQLIVEADVKLLRPAASRVGQIDIVGPSIDRFWPMVDMQAAMIKTGRVSILGDAAGASRGIYQAIASGLMWANRHSEVQSNGADWLSYAKSKT